MLRALAQPQSEHLEKTSPGSVILEAHPFNLLQPPSLSSPLHKTPGIVLRTVKFGETSLVVTVYTRLFGIQSYIVNGVRLHTKKGAGKAILFQPSALLDLVVYHHESAHLNRIREFGWRKLYSHLLTDVKKNAIAMFMVELLTRCIRQPEPNEDLFDFIEDTFLELDKAGDTVAANMPLFFAAHLPAFLGLRMDDNYSEKNSVLDLKEGCFTSSFPSHPDFLEDKAGYVTSQLLKARHPSELAELKLNQEFRRQLLFAFERFYVLHVNDFSSMKTIGVLKEIL